MSEPDRPVFILGFHRGGTTLLQRLLNCSEDMVVWGEHAGILKFYREALNAFCKSPARKRDRQSYGHFEEFVGRFCPWVNPVSKDEMEQLIRKHLTEIFDSNDISKRWGVKEIRYHEPEDAEFIFRMFPSARVVYLHRDPVDIFVSETLVDWTGTPQTREALETAAERFLLRHEECVRNHNDVCSRHEAASIFEFEKIGYGSKEFHALIDFLEIEPRSFREDLLTKVFDIKAGSSRDDLAPARFAPDKEREVRDAISRALRKRSEWSDASLRPSM